MKRVIWRTTYIQYSSTNIRGNRRRFSLSCFCSFRRRSTNVRTRLACARLVRRSVRPGCLEPSYSFNSRIPALPFISQKKNGIRHRAPSRPYPSTMYAPVYVASLFPILRPSSVTADQQQQIHGGRAPVPSPHPLKDLPAPPSASVSTHRQSLKKPSGMGDVVQSDRGNCICVGLVEPC
jgi:hypothetical protein